MGEVVSRAACLLEREVELDRLNALLDGAASGDGGVLLIEAPAGLGKTALLEAAAEAARERGITVLRATCGELEREFPFGACLQLFADPLATGPDRDRPSCAEAPAWRRRCLSVARPRAQCPTRTGCSPCFTVSGG